jgi:hypothetical protein
MALSRTYFHSLMICFPSDSASELPESQTRLRTTCRRRRVIPRGPPSIRSFMITTHNQYCLARVSSDEIDPAIIFQRRLRRPSPDRSDVQHLMIRQLFSGGLFRFGLRYKPKEAYNRYCLCFYL